MPRMMTAMYAAIAAAASDAGDDMLFLSVGDWGGASDLFPTTKSELSNGKGMQAVASKHGAPASFVMLVGDNF